MDFFGGEESSGKPWKNPFQKCPEKGKEQDKGDLQITGSASSRGFFSRDTPQPDSRRPLPAALPAAAGARARRGHTPPRLSGCPAPPELPDGLNFPALSGLAAAAAGPPSRCDS